MQEQIEILQKPPKYYPKTLEAIQLVNAGISPELALKFSNQKDNIRPETVSRFKQKLKKHSLTAPAMVKSAASQVKRILAAEVREIDQQKVTKSGEVVDYKEVIAPSDTNILAAAAMVYDRYEPAIKQTVQINIDVDPVNLDDYRNKATSNMLSNSNLIAQ